MDVRDKLWIWTHKEGAQNNLFGIKETARITPVEGALYLGVPNLLFVRVGGQDDTFFNNYAVSFRPMKRVVWSIIGESSSRENDLEKVCELASRFPNICGAIMDDFFQRPTGNKDERVLSPYSPEQISQVKNKLNGSGRKLDLFIVVYDHQLHLPVKEHLNSCDVITFWTWVAKDLVNMEENFEKLEKMCPSRRKMLGCYMYDYGGSQLMPVESMKKQCETGLRWLKEGRIEGMIFLASCVCDLEYESVEFTRDWIGKLSV